MNADEYERLMRYGLTHRDVHEGWEIAERVPPLARPLSWLGCTLLVLSIPLVWGGLVWLALR